MSQSLYYSVTVKPTIIASDQNAAAYSADDVLFDWTEVEVPKHSGRLVGATILMRGTNGARQEFAFDVYFSTSDTYTLGSSGGNEPVDMAPNNDLIGAMNVPVTAFMDGLSTMEVGNVSTSARLTLTPDPEKVSSTTGRQVLYVGAVAQGNIDWRTNVYATGAIATGQKVVGSLDDGSGSSPTIATNFQVGDVIHNTDDELVGTIASIDSATQFTCVDDVSVAQINNDRLYNIHPLILQLHFGIGG